MTRPHLSVSGYRSWMTCRRAWACRYIWRHDAAPSPFPTMGSVVHAVIEAHQNDAWRTRFDAIFDEVLTRVDPAHRLHEIARAWIRREAIHALDAWYQHIWPRYKILWQERAFRVPIPETDVDLLGIIDALAIDRETGERVILDMKTAFASWDPQKAAHDEQATAYLWIAETHQLGVGSVRFVTFPRKHKDRPIIPEIWETTRDATTITAFIHTLQDTLAAIATATDYPPTPHSFCRFCAYAGTCPVYDRDHEPPSPFFPRIVDDVVG